MEKSIALSLLIAFPRKDILCCETFPHTPPNGPLSLSKQLSLSTSTENGTFYEYWTEVTEILLEDGDVGWHVGDLVSGHVHQPQSWSQAQNIKDENRNNKTLQLTRCNSYER